MESLDDKIKRYRDETLLELEALERRAAALKVAIKAFDDLLNLEAGGAPKAPRPVPGPIDQKIIAACFNWSTVREIVASVPDFQNTSQSNTCTRCRWLWEHRYLERRERPIRNHKYPKRYEYKALNPVKVS